MATSGHLAKGKPDGLALFGCLAIASNYLKSDRTGCSNIVDKATGP